MKFYYDALKLQRNGAGRGCFERPRTRLLHYLRATEPVLNRMKSRFLALLLLWHSLSLAARVNVTLFYAALSPDSQLFFNNELYPALQTSLVSSLKLTLVPYGNASRSEDAETCELEPAEVYGNRVHACAISKITALDEQVSFINCLMSEAREKKPVDKADYKEITATCGNWTEKVAAIEDCADDESESDPLIFRYGNMTKNAYPPLKGLPALFFDGTPSDEINFDEADNNFVSKLCSYISAVVSTERQSIVRLNLCNADEFLT